MFCFHCGNELLDQASFCVSCGSHQNAKPHLKAGWHAEEQVPKPAPRPTRGFKWILLIMVVISLSILVWTIADMSDVELIPKSSEIVRSVTSSAAANMKVTRTGAIRISPFADAQTIKHVRNGDLVIPDRAEGKWTKVSWTGGQGWIETANLASDKTANELTKREIEKRAKQEEQQKQKTFQTLIASYHDSGLRNINDDTVVRIEWDEESWHRIPSKTKQGIFDSFKFIMHKPVRMVGYASGATLARTGLLSDSIN